MNDEQIDKIAKQPKAPKAGPVGSKGTALSHFDEAERKAVLMARTLLYRQRHNTMTNALSTLLPALAITQGARQECRFDVLISNYDAGGRDLLIEAKPDPDRDRSGLPSGNSLTTGDSCRTRRVRTRGFDHHASTERLHGTPAGSPSHSAVVYRFWLQRVSGDGKAWKALEARGFPQL